jgi:hypothetical protein
LVLEQADGFRQHEVGPQLPGIERLDAISASAATGAWGRIRVGHSSTVHVANSKHVTSITV